MTQPQEQPNGSQALALDSESTIERAHYTWMEIEAHLKAAERKIEALRAQIAEFKLPPRARG
jgi:hypothetical protein